MTPEAELFLSFDYAETKALLITFITLVSGVLGLSVSFHDKVLGETATPVAKRWMVWTWALLFAALVIAGLALVIIAFAAACAIYGPGALMIVRCTPLGLGLVSWCLTVTAGLCFIAAFGTLIRAALSSPRML